MIKERNIVVQVLLSIITCGIYGIYWFFTLTDDAARSAEDPNFSGIKSFLFSLITCGIYTFFWNYKMGKTMYADNQKAGIKAEDNSVLYLILSIFGLSIVNYCIIQNELNTLARQSNVL